MSVLLLTAITEELIPLTKSDSVRLLEEAEALLRKAAQSCVTEADCQAVMLATNPSSEAATIARSKFVELRRGPKGGI